MFFNLKKEGSIAENLLTKGVMETKICSDFDNHKQQYTYIVSICIYELFHLRLAYVEG